MEAAASRSSRGYQVDDEEEAFGKRQGSSSSHKGSYFLPFDSMLNDFDVVKTFCLERKQYVVFFVWLILDGRLEHQSRRKGV